MKQPGACIPRSLPREKWVSAAENARRINPLNHAPVQRLARILPDFVPTAEHLALVVTKYWHTDGVRLTVGFLDDATSDLRARILLHMNAWGQSANAQFEEAGPDAQVRISFGAGGYWSYVGTDILSIASTDPTMNLEGFSMDTTDSEFYRVVRHETGHTLGFPHEHMRAELVAKIDPDKAIAYFAKYDNWSPEETRQQVLTPLDPKILWATPHADPNSIMCYQVPGEITTGGQPILGGTDIDQLDYQFAGAVYPRKTTAASTGTGFPSVRSSDDAVLCFPPGTDPQYVAGLYAALRGR